MAKYLPLPDGSSLKVPDTMSYDEAMSLAQKEFPDLFEQPKAPVSSKGLFSELAGGAKSLVNLGQTGLAALTGDATQAAQAGIERQKKIAETNPTGLDTEKIAELYNKGEYFNAGKEALSQIPSAVAALAPSIGQEMGLAAAGRLGGGALGSLAGPAGTVVGQQVGQYAVPFVVNAIQALGGEAQSKVDEQLKKGEKPSVDALELAPYATANAALNLVGERIAMPGIFKKAIGQKVAEETGSATRKALLKKVTEVADRGTIKTIGMGMGKFGVQEPQRQMPMPQYSPMRRP